MAILLYGNGLTEELLPTGLTFTDEELIELFKEFERTRTLRLDDIPNMWCIWGENDKPHPDDYNKFGSDILETHCYSHILFLHDTEVDPSWNLTEQIIYHDYNEFKRELLKFFDEVALETMEEIDKFREEHGNPELIALEQAGVSLDKRIIFKFNPDKQPPDFFKKANFLSFAQKSYAFLKKNYKNGEVFAIFADRKMIIILDDDKVKPYIDHLTKAFEQKEEYIICSEILKIYKKWETFKAKKKTKKSVSKKKEENNGS
jgi:hypothetical protein